MKDKAFGVIPILKKGDEYRFLLVQHRKGHSFREGAGEGHWAFPKGHAHEGESNKEAAVREFREETGIQNVSILDGVSFSEEYSFRTKEKTILKIVEYFLGFVEDERVSIQQNEIQDYRWVIYEEGMRLITFSEGRDILRRAQAYLLQNVSNSVE